MVEPGVGIPSTIRRDIFNNVALSIKIMFQTLSKTLSVWNDLIFNYVHLKFYSRGGVIKSVYQQKYEIKRLKRRKLVLCRWHKWHQSTDSMNMVLGKNIKNKMLFEILTWICVTGRMWTAVQVSP